MTTEHMVEESKRVALIITKRHLERVLNELEWLINSTPTGDARNCICDANTHALSCKAALEGVKL